MTRRSNGSGKQTHAPLSPEVRDAFVTLIEGVLLSQMKAMLKSRDIEERYVGLVDGIRDATEEQMSRIARTAAEYYVSRANPAPSSLSKDEVDRLKKAALDHALRAHT